jgi:hypothetical protein
MIIYQGFLAFVQQSFRLLLSQQKGFLHFNHEVDLTMKHCLLWSLKEQSNIASSLCLMIHESMHLKEAQKQKGRTALLLSPFRHQE